MARKAQKSLFDKLKEPVSWSSFKELVTHEIKFEQDSFGDQQAVVETSAILDHAIQVAKTRKIVLEKLLNEWKVKLDEKTLLILDAKQRKQLIKMFQIQVKPHQAKDKPMDVLFNESSYLRQLKEVIGDINTDDLSEYLAKVKVYDKRFLDKLYLCEAVSEEEIENARTSLRDGQPFWHRLLVEGCSVEALGKLLSTEPYFPFIHPKKGDFAEYILKKDIIRYSQYKDYVSNRLKEEVPTDQWLARFFDNKQDLLEELSEFFEMKTAPADRYDLMTGNIDEKLINLLHIFEWVPLLITDVIIVGGIRPISEVEQEFMKTLGKDASFRLISREDYNRRKAALTIQIKAPETSWSGVDFEALGAPAGPESMVISFADTSAVDLVQVIFEEAVQARATDIHMEPQNYGFRVRHRVDGLLQEAKVIDRELADEVIGRVKILAEMDITERRQPQDGHIKVRIDGSDLNLRVASVPTFRGERIGIRIVDSSKTLLPLSSLGLEENDYQSILGMTKKPYGMILATGPVGSGKTTSLYSCLSLIDATQNNVLSIEDPVEYELDGANQIEVNYKVGFGFVEGLRATLRQDPDTILVGEIRDHETAAIAIRASMTGLLVFSSLHTNDAPGAVTTFYNYQIPPLLIANSLLGVLAQRLVRRLHPTVREIVPATAQEVELFKRIMKDEDTFDYSDFKLAKAVRTAETNYSGYHGRSGIFEVMSVNSTIRDMILTQASEKDIRDEAVRNGMMLLNTAALTKVRNHYTTLDEIKRVVFLD